MKNDKVLVKFSKISHNKLKQQLEQLIRILLMIVCSQ